MVGFTCWQMGMIVGATSIMMVRMIAVGLSFGIHFL